MDSHPLKIGDYIYHPDRSCLVMNGVVIRISENEHKLLELLLRKKRRLVTKEEIIATLWGERHVVVDQGSVNTAVSKLRKCFGDSTTDSNFIKTVRGQGYVLIADVAPLEVPVQEGSGPWPRSIAVLDPHYRTRAPAFLIWSILLPLLFFLWLGTVVLTVRASTVSYESDDEEVAFLLAGESVGGIVTDGFRSAPFEHYAADRLVTCVFGQGPVVCSP